MRITFASAFATMLAALGLLAGCTGSQSRDAYRTSSLDQSDVERETHLHGAAGYTVAELFYTGKIAEARGDFDGEDYGLQVHEFYLVEIAPDALQPDQVVEAGFVRKLLEDRGSLFYFEFFDRNWTKLGYLNAEGTLYVQHTGREVNAGKFQLSEAVRYLFPAESGYGYDTVLQDSSRVRAHDPAVGTLDPRGRGVEHRSHKSHPAIVSLKLYRAGEAASLADSRYSAQRFRDSEEAKLARLREARHGGIAQDEEYGGLQYKNGQPVDENGDPITKRR